MSVLTDMYCRSTFNHTAPSFWKDNIWYGKDIKYFKQDEIKSFVENKSFLFAGDSVCRDTFYQFLNTLGYQIWTNFKPTWKSNKPLSVHSSNGQDIFGRCMGDHSKQKLCTRDISFNNTKVYFNFLTRANSVWETDKLNRINHVDYAFVMCPVHEWMNNNAYNYTNKNRHVVLQSYTQIGPACLTYFNKIREKWKYAKLFLIGTMYPPGYVRRKTSGQQIIQNINSALNISCVYQNNSYKLNKHDILPIDTYSIIHKRTRDMIHPTFDAQYVLVSILFNAMMWPEFFYL